jgi:hypothetical protein
MDNLVVAADKLSVFQTKFKDFTRYQPFLIIAAGVCVGLATREMISAIMNDSILPIVDFILKNTLMYNAYAKFLEEITFQKSFFYLFLKLILRKIGSIIWLLLVWFITIYISYIIFSKLIRLDLVSDKIAMLQATTKYIVDQEKPSYKPPPQQLNIAGQMFGFR